MDKYCQEKGFIGWYETSAKENINIDEASKTLVEKVFIYMIKTRSPLRIMHCFISRDIGHSGDMQSINLGTGGIVGNNINVNL